MSAAFENLRVISGQTAGVNAASVGVDWFAHPLWRASSRLEFRRSGDISGTADNERFNTMLMQGMGAGGVVRP